MTALNEAVESPKEISSCEESYFSHSDTEAPSEAQAVRKIATFTTNLGTFKVHGLAFLSLMFLLGKKILLIFCSRCLIFRLNSLMIVCL